MTELGGFAGRAGSTGADDDMKAVLDTNVWLDLGLFEDPSAARLRTALEARRLVALATPRMRDELADVLTRPMVLTQAGLARARRGAGPACAVRALAFFDALTSMVTPAPLCTLLCTDPDDQGFIDLAIAQRTRWLVSRDRALLRLASRARVRHGLLIGPASLWSEDL